MEPSSSSHLREHECEEAEPRVSGAEVRFVRRPAVVVQGDGEEAGEREQQGARLKGDVSDRGQGTLGRMDGMA